MNFCDSKRFMPAAILAVALVAALAVIIFTVNRSDCELPPPVPAATGIPADAVRVRAVDPGFAEDKDMQQAAVSAAIATVCGGDPATAGRYEARNDALRSIFRNCNLPESDSAALVAYLESPDESLREERVAALKNDVMNLLRRQERRPDGFAETLISMFREGKHPPAVLDYCIQHLGAIQNDVSDPDMRVRIRRVFETAVGRAAEAYAGTALYSIAEDSAKTEENEAFLRRSTVALCKPGENPAARIAAFQLAGERGYAEAAPIARDVLSSSRRDAVLDIVCIGTLGKVGGIEDIEILDRFSRLSSRYASATAAAKKHLERNLHETGK